MKVQTRQNPGKILLDCRSIDILNTCTELL